MCRVGSSFFNFSPFTVGDRQDPPEKRKNRIRVALDLVWSRLFIGLSSCLTLIEILQQKTLEEENKELNFIMVIFFHSPKNLLL